MSNEFYGYAAEVRRVSSLFPIENDSGPEFLGVLPRLTFWSVCIFVFVMAVLPYPPQLPGSPSEKVQHIIAFVTLAMLGHWAYPDLKKRYLLTGLALYGALIEVAQAVPVLNRNSDLLDWVTDVAAALTVLIIVAVWAHLRARRNTRHSPQ